MGAVQNLESFYKKKILGQRSTPTQTQTAAPATGAARGMDDETIATVETDAGVIARKKKGKKALRVAAMGSANVGGEGTSGLNIPKA